MSSLPTTSQPCSPLANTSLMYEPGGGDLLLISCANMSGSSHQAISQFPCLCNGNTGLLSTLFGGELAGLRLTLGLQSCTVGSEQLSPLFPMPLGEQQSGSGTESRWSPRSRLQLQQRPRSQVGVNLPLVEVMGAREDSVVSAPAGEKKGKRWKIHLVTPNSWKWWSL